MFDQFCSKLCYYSKGKTIQEFVQKTFVCISGLSNATISPSIHLYSYIKKIKRVCDDYQIKYKYSCKKLKILVIMTIAKKMYI